MNSTSDRLIAQGARDAEPQGDTRLNRLMYRINLASIVFAVAFALFFLAVGLPKVAAIVSMAAISWTATATLMRHGRPDAARRLQHTTGLSLLGALGVVLGPAVNAHILLLVAASMPPITWSRRERIEWSIHLGTGFTLWAIIESGLLDQFAMVSVSTDMAQFLRIAIALLIFGFLGLITHALIRENQITESQLEEANSHLESQIHVRKGIEAELAEARDEAQRANQTKDNFLANMSHEIRTPMNTIIGLARLCSHDELKPQVREYIDRVRSSCRALLGIINDILDLSRIEAREIELDEVSFDLREVLDHLTVLVGDSASAKGIEFLVVVDPEVPEMMIGDPLRLSQVLTNLTNNSIKFTTDGSVVVRVRLLDHEEDRVHLGFSVEDTGIGIPDELIAGLFESFVQADGSTTRRFGGSGLGLTISKSLVDLMGGAIQVESSVGRGSCFSFDVSLVRTRGSTAERLQPPRGLEGLKVLVVHSNPVASDVMCSLLSSLTFVPRSVQTEAECLEVLAREQDGPQPFALILVDWPDPVEICSRIRTDPKLAGTAIVAMVSSKHRDAVSVLAEQAGIGGVLVKPVRAGALLDIVIEVLGHSSSVLQRRLASSGFIPAVHLIQGSRILVAEHNEANQQVTRSILEDADLDVTMVSNGEQAVREATRRCYDLILMAVHMPLLDGPDATAAIRRNPETTSVPIIAMTADALKETRERCFDCGMNDFVAKPISVAELLTKVVRWIRVDPDQLNAHSSEERTTEPLPEASTLSDIPPQALDTPGDPAESTFKTQTWFSRMIGYGVPNVGPPELIKRRRLANGVVLALLFMSVVYSPIYAAVGLSEIAAITVVMGTLWMISYGLMIMGWHRIGRILAVLVAFTGCTAYALALGPRANYHAILLNGMSLPPIIFTFRERRISLGCGLAAVFLWLVAELALLGSLAPVQVSDAMYALLHANAGLICFGFIGFSICLLARENHKAEDRLQAINTRLQAEIQVREQAQEALVDARVSAEDARLAKSEFLANMSHEIRTPMNAILGLTELCLRAELSADVRDQVTRIRLSGQTLLRIINNILDLSRLEAQKTELERVDFDLGLVLDHVRGSVGPSANSKGLEFLAVMEPEVPRCLLGDPLRLEQVLSNLADNGVNATEQGEVVVRVKVSDHVSSALRFEVSDTGVGFPFASIEEFEEVIGRHDRPTTNRRRGTWLGLTICKNLLELMDGELHVESERGAGSTFWFEVQFELGSEENLAAAPRGSRGGDFTTADKEMSSGLSFAIDRIRGARVLVAEDNEANQLVARGVLEDAGLRVDLVNNGREAVKAVADSDFDLVLMDLHMPVMDGYEASKMIRQDPGNRDLKIVAMTADVRRETREACTEAGMNGHLEKPVDRINLLSNLVAWIEPGNQGETDGPKIDPLPDTAVLLPTELPGLDLEEALERMSGHRRNLIEVFLSFGRRFKGREAEIEEAWLQGDVEQALELAHLVKGLAGNISANELYAWSAWLEEGLRTGNEASLPDLIKEHRRCLDQVLSSLEMIEHTPHDTVSAAEADVSALEIDLDALSPRLKELILLLASRSLQARTLYRELSTHLGGTAMGNDFEAIAGDINSLDFKSAKAKVLDFVSRWGIKIQGAKE